MKYVNGLQFEEEPDYDFLRKIVREEMVKAGCILDSKLEFKLAKLSESKDANKENLDPSLLYGPSKKPPTERVSAVFDSACVSETSYCKLKEKMEADKADKSLENPTQAMLDVMAMMKSPTTKTVKSRRRRKSTMEERTENTPAMVEVLNLKRKRVDSSSSDSEVEFCDVAKKPKNSPENIIAKSKSFPPRKTELQKLLSEPVQRRRTRHDQSVAKREIRSNLRSAINFASGVLRSVSNSLPNFLKYE